MSAMAPITDANPSVEVMASRVARFGALRTMDDYVDAGIPGCERSTYRVLGTVPGAPLEAEAFHMNLVRCAPGKSARCLRLQSWDTISVPPNMSRGFRNVGEAMPG